MKIILLSLAIVAISVLLLGVRVFFVKGGKFPSMHISKSESLRKKGIGCAHTDE